MKIEHEMPPFHGFGGIPKEMIHQFIKANDDGTFTWLFNTSIGTYQLRMSQNEVENMNAPMYSYNYTLFLESFKRALKEVIE